MKTIQDIISGIEEGNLTKEQLEDYSSMLDILGAKLELQLGDIEKSEAMFLADCGEKTRAGATTKWEASELGQSEITLKRQLRAISKLASSVKVRLYQKY